MFTVTPHCQIMMQLDLKNKIRLTIYTQTVIVFFSTFNTPYMCPNIRCDWWKVFYLETKQGQSSTKFMLSYIYTHSSYPPLLLVGFTKHEVPVITIGWIIWSHWPKLLLLIFHVQLFLCDMARKSNSWNPGIILAFHFGAFNLLFFLTKLSWTWPPTPNRVGELNGNGTTSSLFISSFVRVLSLKVASSSEIGDAAAQVLIPLDSLQRKGMWCCAILPNCIF